MNTPTRSLVIDTDTASDDAIALMQAVRHPDVDIRAVTVVAGNVPLSQGVRNALVSLELAGGQGIPVHPGRAAPLLRSLETAQMVHGEDGMGGVDLPEPIGVPSDQHAVEALLHIARTEPGRHHLVTLGPLSNIALAIQLQPDFLSRFLMTWMMLGAPDGRGNVSPVAEFNSWADPEAVAIVLAAEGAKTMVGWDVSRTYAVMRPADDAALRAVGRLGGIAADINAPVLEWGMNVTGIGGYDLPDPITMAVAIDETIIEESHEVAALVSLDAATRGQTYLDRRLPARPTNLRVVTRVNEVAFKQQLYALLRD